MDVQDQVNALLKEYNAVLLRNRKHQVWQLPNGEVFVCSNTPSDWRAAKKSLSTLKHCLGLVDESPKTASAPPKNKKNRTGTSVDKTLFGASLRKTFNRGLAEQLSESGLIESCLRDEIAQLKDANKQLRQAIAAMIEEQENAWWRKVLRFCRLRA